MFDIQLYFASLFKGIDDRFPPFNFCKFLFVSLRNKPASEKDRIEFVGFFEMIKFSPKGRKY